jgi:AcrR family transcriptional regulator
MDEIAAQAGVAKGSLYYHFKSKSELFAAVVCEGLADMRRQIARALDSSDDIRSIMTGFITAHTEVAWQYPELTDLIMGDRFNELDEADANLVRQARADYFAYLAGLIDQGIRAGYLRPCNSLAAATSFLMFLHTYLTCTRSQGSGPDTVVREASGLILDGLRRKL